MWNIDNLCVVSGRWEVEDVRSNVQKNIWKHNLKLLLILSTLDFHEGEQEMEQTGRAPLRVINSDAPIRIADNGGSTDTWFSGHGKIFNIGVYPYAEVQLEVFRHDGRQDRVMIQAGDYQALELGYHVTAFVRKPSKLKTTHERLTVVSGNVLDYDSLASAVLEKDAVVCALGHN